MVLSAVTVCLTRFLWCGYARINHLFIRCIHEFFKWCGDVWCISSIKQILNPRIHKLTVALIQHQLQSCVI